VNHVVCDQCGREFAMNDTIKLHGRPLCVECAEKALAGTEKVPKEAV
jgi:formylmethanofuran dehydrogenase subunit E